MFFMIKTVWVVCLKLSSFTVQREILFRCACVGGVFFQRGGVCAYIFCGVQNTGVCSFSYIVLSAQ